MWSLIPHPGQPEAWANIRALRHRIPPHQEARILPESAWDPQTHTAASLGGGPCTKTSLHTVSTVAVPRRGVVYSTGSFQEAAKPPHTLPFVFNCVNSNNNNTFSCPKAGHPLFTVLPPSACPHTLRCYVSHPPPQDPLRPFHPWPIVCPVTSSHSRPGCSRPLCRLFLHCTSGSHLVFLTKKCPSRPVCGRRCFSRVCPSADLLHPRCSHSQEDVEDLSVTAAVAL